MNIIKKDAVNNRFALATMLVVVVYLTSLTVALAQKSGWDGEIENVEITIENTREIKLPPANRHFEKIPPRASEPITPPIQYDFRSFSFSAPQINPQIRPLKIKAQNPAKVYGGFVRAGYGNYASPLLEGYVNSAKDKDKLVGAHLYHNSSTRGPVDGRNSGSGTTTASVFGKSFNEYVALSGALDVENRSTHFYGYPEGVEVDRSSIRQAYNLFKLSGSLSNANKSDFAYKLGGLFSYMADKFDARETEVNLDFNSSFEIDDDKRINIKALYALISRKDSEIDAKPRNLFMVTPKYSFSPVEDLKISLGITAGYETDTLDSKDLHIYPDIVVSYPFTPSIEFVGSLTGGLEKVTLQTLSNKNIWIGQNVPVYHANKFFDLSLAIHAKLGNKIGAHTGLSVASINNMHYFVNSDVDQSKFDVIYDNGQLSRTNLFGSLSYAQSENVKLMLRGDVFAYGTSDVQEAWHLPKYKLNASAAFNVYQKILINLDVLGQGGLKGREPITGNTIKLDGALDLNVKAEYLFSPGFSFFVQGNNLASSNYPVYLYYPVRGLQVLGGITWSF